VGIITTAYVILNEWIQYVNKMIEVAVDSYKASQQQGTPVTNPRLEAIIDRIFQLAQRNRDFSFIIALALDCRRLDFVKAAIIGAGEHSTEQRTQLLMDTVQKVWESQLGVEFRGRLLDLIFQLFAEMEEPDFVSMCQCLIRLEKPDKVAEILQRLLKAQDSTLLAYQLAFDLYENASQQFIHQINAALDETISSTNAQQQTSSGDEPMDEGEEEAVQASTASAVAVPSDEGAKEVVQRLKRILSGEETIKHHMQFLIKNNHTDMLLLKQIKVRGGKQGVHMYTKKIIHSSDLGQRPIGMHP